MKELADLAATPAEDTSKRHKHIKERQELWKELTNNDDSDKSSQQMTEKVCTVLKEGLNWCHDILYMYRNSR